MNLFHHFLHLLSGSSKKPAEPVTTESAPNNCEYLLSNLQRICAMLPDGEASVVMGRNKLDICLTWDTAMQANADNIKKKNKEFQFWLNGKSEVVEWAETMMQHSPLALRMIKAGLNAELDGQAGIQELAGDATMLYYMTEEAQEGGKAFLEKRKPDWSKFPKMP